MASRKELEAKLKPNQLKAALLLVEKDLSEEPGMAKSMDEIAEACGVKRMTIYRWNQEPTFIEYRNMLAKDILASYQSQVFSELMGSIKKHKSIRAMELFFKIQNLLKESKEISIVEGKEKSKEELEKEIMELDNLLNEEE